MTPSEKFHRLTEALRDIMYDAHLTTDIHDPHCDSPYAKFGALSLWREDDTHWMVTEERMYPSRNRREEPDDYDEAEVARFTSHLDDALMTFWDECVKRAAFLAYDRVRDLQEAEEEAQMAEERDYFFSVDRLTGTVSPADAVRSTDAARGFLVVGVPVEVSPDAVSAILSKKWARLPALRAALNFVELIDLRF